MRLHDRKRVRIAELSSDPRRIGALATTVAVLIATVVLSFAAGSNPLFAVGVAAVFLFAALLIGNPSWIVHGLLLSLFVTMPTGDKGGIRIAGYFIYYYEPFLVGSLIYVTVLLLTSPEIGKGLRKSMISRATISFGIIVGIGTGLGLLRGYPLKDIQEDVRPVVNMMIAVLVCAVIVAIKDYRRYLRTVTAILLLSAAYTVYGSVTGKSIGGRTETAQLVGVGGDVLAGGSTALRFLTNATPLAMAVLLGGVTLILLGRVTAKQAAPMLIPALVISFLGFSRNTILALAGALLFTIVIAVVDGQVMPVVRRFVMVAAVATITVAGLSVFGHAIGGGDWVDVQLAGYTNRVLEGLSQSNEQADNSTQFRVHENEYIKSSGAQHPILGGGFGFRYKPPAGSPGSWEADKAQLYAHNSYGWIYVKTGVVGVGAFLILIAASALPALGRRRSSPVFVAAASTIVGLSVAMIVIPFPVNHGNSALLGLVLGICLGAGTFGVNRLPKLAAPDA